MIIGTLGAAAIGTAMPSFALLWGNMTNTFGNSDASLVAASKQIMIEFILIGIGAFIAGWLMYACWMIAGQRQAIQCRKQYLKSLIKQQIGWFDQINQAQLSSKFSADCFAYQGAIGQKVSLMIQTLAMFIAGFIIAFVKGWVMTLVVLAAIPVLGIAGIVYMTGIQNKQKRNAQFYSKAGGLAQQALSSIKTVKQLNGQQFQVVQYQKCLTEASQKGTKYAIFAGIGMGVMSFSMLASHALGFWFGSTCVQGNSSCPPNLNGGQTYQPGDVLIIFFCVLMAALNLSQLSPALKKIAQGKQAANRIFQIIDREPLIKNSQNPKIPQVFRGYIKFNNVTFAYPKNKTQTILKNLNIEFNSNNSALVGQSGCGKSTILQLVMRFYDPDEGFIELDGINLKNIDLQWLRSHIGYVGQQPVLFAMSIKENLLFGKQNATDFQIIQALKQAEAYDFIQGLDDGINTYVGSGGGQLSGGQKQRIAIARALLRNPQVLLLDQATSALDRKNEKLIQRTLDKIAKSRTTITVAHRTKTIMSSDIIYVLNKGGIQQKGKFFDLKRYKGYEVEKDEQQEVKNIKQEPTLQRKQSQKIINGENQIIVQQQTKVLTKEQQQKLQKEELLKKYEDGIYTRLFSYAQGSFSLLALGVICAILNGLVYPIFSIFFAKLFGALFQFATNPSQARTDSNKYSLVFLIIAIIAFFTNSLQNIIFSTVGEKITKKVRIQTYSKILKMPIPWFDIPKNSGGSLTAKLASDSLMVNALTATFVSILVQNGSTLIAGVTVALVFEWRTALIAIGLLPFMLLTGVLSMKRKAGFSDQTDQIYQQSSQMIMECMMNIRTVTSFGYQQVVVQKYNERLREPQSIGIKKGNVSGFLMGLSQIIMFTVFGLIFYLGSIFKADNHLSIQDVFTAIFAIFFSAMTAGNNSHFMPDVQQGKVAAGRLFQIMDSEDEDQMQIREGSKLLKTPIEGDIKLEGIDFKYDSRHTSVFEGFNFQIKKGTKVAFVGASGCGKSTVFQLLQRFYFPQKGKISIDGQNIIDYDIHHLRKSLGVVSQQPTLFNGSFRQNIKYNIQDASEQQIRAVALSANAISFIQGIEKLEKKSNQEKQQKKEKEEEGTGFDRSVGVKGSQISGGQKQRVAIARTLLRRPAVLLLDQATSALDSNNQKIVQAALDKIMENRTTLSIAHRIDTIKNSDQINVFQKGRVAQSGKYDQLVRKKGYFYNLQRGTQFI